MATACAPKSILVRQVIARGIGAFWLPRHGPRQDDCGYSVTPKMIFVTPSTKRLPICDSRPPGRCREGSSNEEHSDEPQSQDLLQVMVGENVWIMLSTLQA